MKKRAITTLAVYSLTISSALAECYGSGSYRVCSNSYTDSKGNIHVKSYDSQGNSYHVDSESYQTSNGSVTTSSDSEGNRYSIKTWTDSQGTHTEDSEGNRCTITNTGTMIGC